MNPDRGTIVWVNFNPQKDHKQSGRRPALVISPSAYNAISNCILVCPITSNIEPWPWKVFLPENDEINGAVLVDQIKSIDANARQLEMTKQTLDKGIMNEILSKLNALTG